MARKNPTHSVSSDGYEFVGGTQLPNAMGVNQEALAKGNAMPDVNMSPNDGDNKDVSMPPFANGKDQRNQGSSPSSDPSPAMPGA